MPENKNMYYRSKASAITTDSGSTVEEELESLKNTSTHTHTPGDIITDEDHQFISSEEKENINKNAVYTNLDPTILAVGGIPAGTTFQNKKIQDILTMMMYPYTKPVVSTVTMTLNSTAQIYAANNQTYYIEAGEQYSVSKISFSITKKSSPISSILYRLSPTTDMEYTGGEFSNGGSFVMNINHSMPIGENLSSSLLVVEDEEGGSVVKQCPTVTYVYPYYFGSGSQSQRDFSGLIKMIKPKGQIVQNFTCDNESMILAYPASYGVLKSIKDQNNFEVLDTFNRYSVEITYPTNNTVISYYFYINDPSTVTNFKMTFSF